MKALLVGIAFAAASIGVGYLLARVLPGVEWLPVSVAVLFLVSVYLLASSYPRRMAPSHTFGPRSSVQDAGLQQMAFQEGLNPGQSPRPRTWNLDMLLSGIAPLCTAVALVVVLVS